MASTWCSQGRWRRASRAAWGLGNRGADTGRQPGGLEGDTGGSCTCSFAATPCRGRGLTVPQCKLRVLGFFRIYVEACYCFARILCAGCSLLLACWRQGQVTCVTTPAWHEGPSPGQWRWQPWEIRGTVLAQKGQVLKGWDWEGAGSSLGERLLKKLKPLFLSLPLLLSFPSISACPPLPPALCRHLIIYIKLTFAEFTQGSVIVFFHRFCITNHENGILSSLTNF